MKLWKIPLSVAVFSLQFTLAHGENKTNQAKTPMPVADVLARIHWSNQHEMQVGQLIKTKGATREIRNYGDRLFRDHQNADAKILALARDHKITINDPTPLSEHEKAMMARARELPGELESLTGAELERRFLAAMKTDHEESIRMLQSVDTGDRRTQRLVRKIVPILQQHWALADHIDHRLTAQK